MLRTLKAKINAKTILMLIPSAIFLVFIFYMLARNVTGEVKETIKDTEISFYGFSQLSGEFEDTLQENFYQKNDFINLNGLTTRVLGINTLNERHKLANGYLARTENEVDTSDYSASVIELDEFLSDRGIEFLYVLAPSKEAFYGTEFLPGYSSSAWKNIDSMISALDSAGVNTLDMDAWFEENGWSTEDVYFITDHHWMPQAGLAAARVTMELLSQQGLAEYDSTLLEDDSWTVTVLEDWFLGSHGKRVGTLYAGVDDISVYTPNFATNYSYSGLPQGSTTWRYSDSILNLSYTESIDYFGSDPHCIYLYGEYPVQIIKNTEACNNKRVLVVGDSFRRVWEYFLTTQFSEIYSIDPRYYTDGSFVQYVEEIQPDIVIMCSNTYSLGSSVYTFGIVEYEAALAQTQTDGLSVTDLSDAAIAASDSANSFTVLCTDLTPGQTYTLTVDGTAYSGGEDLYVQTTLQDLSTNKAIYNRYFDANSADTQTWIFTVPEGSDTYAIYFYAGTKGHTANVSASLEGVRLYTGIYEQP